MRLPITTVRASRRYFACDSVEPIEHTQAVTIRTPTPHRSHAPTGARSQHWTSTHGLATPIQPGRHPQSGRHPQASDFESSGAELNRHLFARRDSKPTPLRGTNREPSQSHPHIRSFSHSPILTERATSTCHHVMQRTISPPAGGLLRIHVPHHVSFAVR